MLYLNTYMQITSIQSFYDVIGSVLNVTKRFYNYDPETKKNTIEEVTYSYTLYDKKGQTHSGPAAHSIDVQA